MEAFQLFSLLQNSPISSSLTAPRSPNSHQLGFQIMPTVKSNPTPPSPTFAIQQILIPPPTSLQFPLPLLLQTPHPNLGFPKSLPSSGGGGGVEETLEWPAVCSQLAAFASTAAGRSLCQEVRTIGRDKRESQKLLDQTATAVLLREPLDFAGVEDVSEMVRVAAAGEMLTVRELCAVERSLRSARRVYEQLEQASLTGESAERHFQFGCCLASALTEFSFSDCRKHTIRAYATSECTYTPGDLHISPEACLPPANPQQ